MNDRKSGFPGRVASPVDDADRDVLLRVANGQLDALQELYDSYRTMAYSIALRITSDASLAEDVVQDAFLGAWRNAARYVEGKGSVKTWLLSIVHHRAVDAVRRRRPTVELPEREDIPPASSDAARHLAGGRGQPRSRGDRDGPRDPVRRPARSDRARLLRRPHPAGDRRPNRHTARDGQEPDPPGPALDAPRPGR